MSGFIAVDSFRGEFAFLSNFYGLPVPIVANGLYFHTAEHYYQSRKTNLHYERAQIALARTAGKAKRLGSSVTLRDDWVDVRVDVMRETLRLKFAQQPLRQMLIETGSMLLQEGNTWGDSFWGVDATTGIGENNLGKLLMEIRDEIK